MKWYAKLYTRLVFIFLYLPIIVLIVCSFNESKSRSNWTGFSFHWYKELFHNELILSSLRNIDHRRRFRVRFHCTRHHGGGRHLCHAP